MKESTFEKYKLVIDEYFNCSFNGAAAYRKYYPKCTIENAASRFYDLVRISEVQKYLQSKYDTAKETSSFTHKKLLQTLTAWIESDITDTICVTPEGLKELPKETRQLITSYKHTKTTFEGGSTETIDLKFVSKEKAAEMIARHTGFYEKDNSQQNEVIIVNG